MKRMFFNERQKKEMDRIYKFFMECVEPISDTSERAIVSVKIGSHLGCFADRLVGCLNKDYMEVEYYKLAYGAQFKYSKSDNRIWTKLPDNMIAEYDKKLMTSGGWHGQKICTFDDNNNHNRKVWVES